ncbi:MAG TPA: DNA primase [Ornithinimicrobium sp.]|uniref:DNA primase n=1 Tax=Ornithinimicrobium sp. TaxID=1977084 RepID=UPI002B48E845|nr:DNA primase [Ornithinimicrobium sp.]HKJ11602.1 DNA primase [Ornithinimicrobium sp.]
MAGLIKTDDVQAVKERASIEDVVREHVTLRPAGTGSLKGLCPFHDEKTPSFTVRPTAGAWHCFGCGEGGDILAFVMAIDHLSFAEAVERLAAQLGMELHYEEHTGGRPGDGAEGGGLGRRTRLVEANRAAAEFYHTALLDSAEARAARDFLRGKGFNSRVATSFQVGFAPSSGGALAGHLRDKGFSEAELVSAGLVGRGQRGLYDRFRGRVIWPIRDITGDTVGFGARRLFDEDRIAAKYLNTAETPIYKKTAVLYGLDLAKKSMASSRQAVIVEGYTDVMACHMAGIEVAVATCGTSFGVEHIKTLRRILRDEPGVAPARVVFTFDGDAAGQKAAMRAYEQDQRWASQSYVAVAPAGQDPNDLRQSAGDGAVRELIDGAVPMFDFAVRTTMAPYDLDRTEQRVDAMRAVAPIVAAIRDSTLRAEYVRSVAGWLGVDAQRFAHEVAGPGQGKPREPAHPEPRAAPEHSPEDAGPALPVPDLRDPVVAAERQLLQVALQYPHCLVAEDVDALPVHGFRAPAHQSIWHAVRQAGGIAAAEQMSAAGWTSAVAGQTPPLVAPMVAELVVAGLPVTLEPGSGEPPLRYVDSLVDRVVDASLGQRIDAALSALQRSASDQEATRALSEELTMLHRERARLRARVE